jgi:hypothetical protein
MLLSLKSRADAAVRNVLNVIHGFLDEVIQCSAVSGDCGAAEVELSRETIVQKLIG